MDGAYSDGGSQSTVRGVFTPSDQTRERSVSNVDTKVDVARRNHEGVPPLSSSSPIGHFIKWKRAKRHTALLHEAGYLLLGLVSLATVTGLYFWLDVPLVAAAFTYLVVLVLLALVSNLSSLIVLSFIGVGCLSYFFAPPIYSFRVDYPQDVIAISAFMMTSFVVNFLVTRVRDANQRLEVTNTALRTENVERKRAEQALRESEYKLRQIFETEPGLTWSTGSDDSEGEKAEVQPGFLAQVRAILNVLPAYTWYSAPSGGLTFVNKRTAEYLGIPKDHPLRSGVDIGATWDDWVPLLHPDDQEESRNYWSNCLRTGEGGEQSYRVRSTQGDYRWFLSRFEPLRASDGNLLLWIGATLDIEELKRSEAYLAEAQGLSHTGTWVLNPTTMQYLYWSDESYQIWAFDPLQGFPSRDALWQRIRPDDRERVWEKVQEALRQKRDYSGEFRIVLPDGTVKYLAATSRHLFSTNGELVEVIGTNVDVTERKRAEEALRESEARARSALDGIAGLIVVLAPNGEVETINRQVFEYFGRSLEWLKNWGTNDAVHPEDLRRIAESFQRSLAAGTPFHYELRLRRSDGEYRWFDTRHLPIRDDSGRIARWYILATDIEDRTRALAQLEQMQSDFAHMNRVSMMGELAASLSHEITQPIASARNNARAAQNFLDMQPPDLGEVREALNCVVGDTGRAGDIVDRIRDHIKKTPPRKEHFDLNEAINEVIVLGRSAIIKNGVSVQTRLAEGLSPIHCDRVQLQQVVLNLILNAAEAMGSVDSAPRDLLISTEQQPTGVLVAVRDTGPGIDPAHLERVFEAFYTTKSRGVGMGLSICRSIIDAHGGRLWAEANEPRGAIFQFTLPAAQVGS
jgi:PAS domain S-box-containing protein